MPPTGECVDAWSLADEAILEGSGNFRRWACLDEVGHWEYHSEGYAWSLPLAVR
jgi:hypothetical protein